MRYQGVAEGVDAPPHCDNPEHKWEIKASLARDFEAHIKKFEHFGTLGTATVVAGQVQGPRPGFVWAITRLTVSIQPFLVAAATSCLPANGFNADIAFFETQRGAMNPTISALPEVPFGGPSPMLAYLQISNLVSGGWCHETFGPEACHLRAGKDLGFFMTMSAALNGSTFVISGQAIEVPEARGGELIY